MSLNVRIIMVIKPNPERITTILGKILNLSGLFKSIVDKINPRIGADMIQYVKKLLTANNCSYLNILCRISPLKTNTIIKGNRGDRKIEKAITPNPECFICLECSIEYLLFNNI